jgi:hypothetical protein
VARSVGIDILHRLLVVHAVSVNIRQGVDFGRMPEGLFNMNLLQLLRTAVITKDDLVASPQEEWILELIHQDVSTVDVNQTRIFKGSHERKSMGEFVCVLNGILLDGWGQQTEKNESESSPQDLIDKVLSNHANNGREGINEYIRAMKFSCSTPNFNEMECELLVYVEKLLRHEQFSSVLMTIIFNLLTTHPEMKGQVAMKSVEHSAKFLQGEVFAQKRSQRQPKRMKFTLSMAQTKKFVQVSEKLRPSLTESHLMEALFDILRHAPPEIRNGGHKGVICHFEQLWYFLARATNEISNFPPEFLRRKWESMRNRKHIQARKTKTNQGANIEENIPKVSCMEDEVSSSKATNGTQFSASTVVSNRKRSNDEVVTPVCRSELKEVKRHHIRYFTIMEEDFIARRKSEHASWGEILQEFGEHFGTIQHLSEDTLRKRYKRTSAKKWKEQAQVLQAAAAINKTDRKACPPCHQSKRRCDGKHSQCHKRQKPPHETLTFFWQ